MSEYKKSFEYIFSIACFGLLFYGYTTSVQASDYEILTGFEGGSTEECNGITSSPEFTASAARTKAYGLRINRVAGDDEYCWVGKSMSSYIIGTTVLIGTAIRIEDTTPTKDVSLVILKNSSNDNVSFELVLDTTGAVYFCAANTSNCGSISSLSASAPFTDNSWHYVEIFVVMNNAGSGSAEVWVDGSSVLSDSTLDYYDNTNSLAIQFCVRNVNRSCDEGTSFDFDDAYLSVDPVGGSSGRLVQSSSDPWPEVFGYQCAQGSTCTSNGDALDTGGWDDTGDQPISAAVFASYTGTPRSGEVEMDAGARAGPSGDPDIDGTSNIRAANWWFYLTRGSGGGTTHTLRFGNSSDTASSSTQSIGGDDNIYRRFSTGTEVPTDTEYCLMGMDVSGAQDLNALEFICYILHVPDAPDAPVDTTPKRKMRLFEGYTIKLIGNRLILYGI